MKEQKEQSPTIELLDGRFLVHKSVIDLVWRLGRTEGALTLRDMFCEHHEQLAIIDHAVELYGCPNELTFSQRLQILPPTNIKYENTTSRKPTRNQK
jgi:hypothetical protein|tara:strand:- start:15287 stop:15577 length:291 start_codon:yes stop_codon:yes gene_type:complete